LKKLEAIIASSYLPGKQAAAELAASLEATTEVPE